MRFYDIQTQANQGVDHVHFCWFSLCLYGNLQRLQSLLSNFIFTNWLYLNLPILYLLAIGNKPAGQKISFFVARNCNWISAEANSQQNVTFDVVLTNDGAAFDTATNSLIAPQTGFYWIHLSVGVTSDADYCLEGAGMKAACVYRRQAMFNSTLTMTSRSILLSVQQGSSLWLSSTSALYSDSYLQVSCLLHPCYQKT